MNPNFESYSLKRIKNKNALAEECIIRRSQKRTVIGMLALLSFCFIINSEVNAETYEYDKLNRLSKVIYEDGSYSEYIYDSNGNMISFKSYDKQNQLITEEQTNNTSDAIDQNKDTENNKESGVMPSQQGNRPVNNSSDDTTKEQVSMPKGDVQQQEKLKEQKRLKKIAQAETKTIKGITKSAKIKKKIKRKVYGKVYKKKKLKKVVYKDKSYLVLKYNKKRQLTKLDAKKPKNVKKKLKKTTAYSLAKKWNPVLKKAFK